MSDTNVNSNVVLKPDDPFVLVPPNVVAPVRITEVPGSIPLPTDLKTKVEAQLDSFMDGLMKGDPHSDEFKAKLDSAFSIGRNEIVEATTLSSRFTKENFVGVEDTAAYKAISNMRSMFDELNPSRQGDLFTPNRIFGITIPFGSKFTRYMRRCQSAGSQMSAIQSGILAAKDEVAKDVAEMGQVRQQMWAALENLEAAACFIKSLDQKLSATIPKVKPTDPDRARAFEQEGLQRVRQNYGDVQAAQALTINAYNVLGELRKTGRETMNGCDRVATLGAAALSIADTLARATGSQIAKPLVPSSSKQDGNENLLSAAAGAATNNHVDLTAKFASQPVAGVQMLQDMFNKAFEAMDKMEKYRSYVLETLLQNNQMITDELAKAAKLMN